MLIGGGGGVVYSYSCSARRISFDINSNEKIFLKNRRAKDKYVEDLTWWCEDMNLSGENKYFTNERGE